MATLTHYLRARERERKRALNYSTTHKKKEDTHIPFARATLFFIRTSVVGDVAATTDDDASAAFVVVRFERRRRVRATREARREEERGDDSETNRTRSSA